MEVFETLTADAFTQLEEKQRNFIVGRLDEMLERLSVLDAELLQLANAHNHSQVTPEECRQSR